MTGQEAPSGRRTQNSGAALRASPVISSKRTVGHQSANYTRTCCYLHGLLSDARPVTGLLGLKKASTYSL